MSPSRVSVVGFALMGMAAIAGCVQEPSVRTPGSHGEPVGHCNYGTISDGQRICLISEPLVPLALMRQLGQRQADELGVGTGRSGLRTEDLGDPLAPGPLPTRVDLREDYLAGCLQVRNQGECGWCVGNASAAALDALYCAEGCPPPRVSMPHLWATGHDGAIGDCGPGWWVHEGLGATTTTPLVGETDWAFTGGSRGMNETRPGPADLRMDGRYRATGYSMIVDPNTQPFLNRLEGLPFVGPVIAPLVTQMKVDRIKRALASGRAVVVASGLCWSEGWDSGAGTLDAPMGPCGPMNPDGTQADYDGHHAYTIVGYDEATGEFLALNSWGTGWGDGGYMRLSAAFVEKEIYSAGYLDQIDRSAGGCEMPDAGMPDAAPAADAGPGVDGGPGSDAGADAGPGPGSRLAARCAAITDCGRCAVTTGCISCDGRCVAADATRTGAADGSSCTTPITDPAACDPPPSACGAHTDCDGCGRDPSCAWCQRGSGGVCVAWPASAASCSGTRVATRSDQCNDATGACEAAGTCESCQMLVGCGWCEGRSAGLHSAGAAPCVGGNAERSDRASCDATWHGPGTMCPAPDAGVEDGGGGAADAGPPGDAALDCTPAQASCMATTECCDSLVCSDGACCGLPSAACATGADCCPGIPCAMGQCQCRASGESCRATRDCCGSDVCRGGICQRP
jgi:hypothetical protein